jgi:hypothetical protein
MRRGLCVFVVMLCGLVVAQEAPSAPAAGKQDESQLGADFRHEGMRFKENCGTFSFNLGSIGSCANQLFTDHPLHIAVGSLAPQNGIGLGPALVAHKTPNDNWRLSWDFDAVASPNGSWRAGGYMKIINTNVPAVVVHEPSSSAPGTPHKKKKIDLTREYPVYNLYAQGISLNTIYYFGEGPQTTLADRSVYGMEETIIGGNANYPILQGSALKGLKLALLGEVNGRFVTIRGVGNGVSPSILALYNSTTAPGLNSQPATTQFSEGLRMKPIFFSDHLQLNYVGTFQQYVSSNNFSFRRWTVDLGHDFILYGKSQMTLSKSAKKTKPCKDKDGLPISCPSLYVAGQPKTTNGPDECAVDPGATCPPISLSRNREGTASVRLVLSESIAPKGNVVPFYFQPTLGGSDIDGNLFLGSYEDYRFRAPNIILIRESFEHNIWGPFGGAFVADQGKVALSRGNINLNNLDYSVAAGLTLRAGGMPFVYLMFAWGGNEGNHTTATINNSLLGGSARPSLF